MNMIDQFAMAALANMGPLPRSVTAEEASCIAADAYEIAGAMMAQREIVAEENKATKAENKR